MNVRLQPTPPVVYPWSDGKPIAATLRELRVDPDAV
jgi:hypothetical protein